MSKKNQVPDIEAEIRRRIEKRFDKRAEFFSHLIAFLVINGAGWGILLRMGMAPLLMTICGGISLLWGMGLAIHAVQYLFEEGKERTIQREIERERAARAAGYTGYQPFGSREKSKNRPDISDNRLIRLTSDGELIEDEDDGLDSMEDEDQNQQQSRSRPR